MNPGSTTRIRYADPRNATRTVALGPLLCAAVYFAVNVEARPLSASAASVAAGSPTLVDGEGVLAGRALPPQAASDSRATGTSHGENDRETRITTRNIACGRR